MRDIFVEEAEMAVVKPAKTDEYHFAQSKYPQLPEIPFRAILAAPGGAGKTVLLQSVVLDLYRTKSGKSPFSRVYIWSPSVNVDPAWKPVKKNDPRGAGCRRGQGEILLSRLHPRRAGGGDPDAEETR